MQNPKIKPYYHIDRIRINSNRPISELSSILNLPVPEDYCTWVYRYMQGRFIMAEQNI